MLLSHTLCATKSEPFNVLLGTGWRAVSGTAVNPHHRDCAAWAQRKRWPWLVCRTVGQPEQACWSPSQRACDTIGLWERSSIVFCVWWFARHWHVLEKCTRRAPAEWSRPPPGFFPRSAALCALRDALLRKSRRNLRHWHVDDLCALRDALLGSRRNLRQVIWLACSIAGTPTMLSTNCPSGTTTVFGAV